MATEASRSNGDGNGNGATADSYIGSLISLISKSEIRYEGLLFNISTSESSIGLRNVKSFGTEGRKKDGPQVPPSDKVYEYILFRGNDIKDLQVKSSQPVESTSSLYQDPAIIQSHYSQGAATSTSSHIQQAGLPKSTPQSSLPLYQPSTISGSWGFTPMPPITNSSSFPMPMYMQGFYGASEGIQTPQQSLLQSPSGLSIPPSMQQYPVPTASIPSRTSNFSALPFSVSTGPLLPPFSTGTLNSNLMPSAQLSALVSDTSTTLTSNKALTQALPTAALSSGLPWASPPESVLDRSTFSSETVAGSLMSYDIGFKPQPSDAGSSSSFPSKGSTPLLVTPNQLLQPGPTANGLFRSGPTTNEFLQPRPTENGLLQPQPKPNQVLQTGSTPNPFLQPAVGNQNLQLEHTPSQLLQPGLATSQVFHPGSKSNQHLQPGITASSSNYTLESAQKDVEVVQVPSPRLPLTTSKENREPILPLPSPHDYKVNGHPSYTRYNSRGGHDRFRGPGGLRQHVPRFTEEFDFTAMNEKFNKDEIWGDLGKGNTTGEEQGSPDEDHSTKSNLELKPVYVKDDFFDSISCNVSDRASKNGRTNFSELRKLDVETFGNFARHGGGHGYSNTGRGFGHGYNRGGRGYGNNNGRGYGGRGYGGGGNNGRGHSGYDRSYGYNGRGYGHHAT